MPSICVCTAPLKAIVQTSEFELLIEGDIALGGGDLTVVVLSPLVVTLLFDVLSVTIGSARAKDVDNRNITKKINFFILVPFLL